jgi:uncharacterized phage protein (TIGR02218 family)
MTYPLEAAISYHLSQRMTSLAVCWRVIRRDNVEILGTTHDRDIEILAGEWAGTYRARASISGSDVRSGDDMSVDNLEVTGSLSTADLLIDLSAADIEAGLLDNADVSTFLVNWQDPDGGVRVLRSGWTGNVTRTAEGQYKTELRGLAQALTQTIGRTLGVGCDAELFDSRCKLSTAGRVYTGSVATITAQRRTFTVTYDTSGPPASGDLIGGKITFNTGNNAGYSKEIRDDDPAIKVFDKFAKDIQVGDEFTVWEGCPKTLEACRDRFNNLKNFRGPMVFAPGDTAIIKVGKR